MKKVVAVVLVICGIFIAGCVTSGVTPEGQKNWEQYQRGQTP